MNIVNAPARTVLLALGLLFAPTLLAHNKLTSVVPADGAVLAASPSFVELGFADPTYLDSVEVETAEGQAVVLDFESPSELLSGFRIPLPTLDAGTYRVHWKVEGSDTHVLEGEFTFNVQEATP